MHNRIQRIMAHNRELQSRILVIRHSQPITTTETCSVQTRERLRAIPTTLSQAKKIEPQMTTAPDTRRFVQDSSQIQEAREDSHSKINVKKERHPIDMAAVTDPVRPHEHVRTITTEIIEADHLTPGIKMPHMMGDTIVARPATQITNAWTQAFTMVEAMLRSITRPIFMGRAIIVTNTFKASKVAMFPEQSLGTVTART